MGHFIAWAPATRTPLASRHNLARICDLAGHREDAVRRYQQTLADCTRILGPDHLIARTVQQGLASHLPQDSDHDPYILRRRRP